MKVQRAGLILKEAPYHSTEERRQMTLPLEYHVTINQKKQRNTSIVIGMSEPRYLTLER